MAWVFVRYAAPNSPLHSIEYGRIRVQFRRGNGGRPSRLDDSTAEVGERRAFRLAVAARKEMLEMVADRPYLYHRTAKRGRRIE
jgi:hypothetical protein